MKENKEIDSKDNSEQGLIKESLLIIQEFLKESNNAGDAISNTLAKGSYVVVDLGTNLLDHYIKLLSTITNISIELLEWFIYENEFGRKKLKIVIEEVEYAIDSIDTFIEVNNKYLLI